MNWAEAEIKIGGMSCVNCQERIRRRLASMDGVGSVSVSYNKGRARVKYDPRRVSLDKLRGAVENEGYKVLPDGKEEPDLVRAACLLAIMVALYVLLQRFGILNLLVPSRLADSGMGYGALFAVGLLTSLHCVAMCGGIGLSQCLPDGSEGKAVFLPSLLYNAGRVASYTGVGFLLGLAGFLLGGGEGAGVPVLLQGILKIAAGAVMVIMGLNMLGLFPFLRRLTPRMPRFLTRKLGEKKVGAARPFAVGLLNGLMPCGPLQSMQILALASGSPLVGALSMLLFSLGTVPLMLGLGTLVSALGRRFSQLVLQVGAVLVAVLGLAMLSQGGSLSGMLPPDRLLFLVLLSAALGLAALVPVRKRTLRPALLAAVAALVVLGALAVQRLAGPAEADDRSSVRIEDGVQIVESTLLSGQYPDIMVQAGIPVRWTIYAPEGSVNGCNYKMIIREYGVEHAFEQGENLIEFTPTQTGSFSYSCWMGMIQGSITVI